MSPQEFVILPIEGYLDTEVRAFYHTRYTRFQSPNNPDYLNDLKNTFNNFSSQKLESATKELRKVLINDLPYIRSQLGIDSITVCVVPRAKAEDTYSDNQKLFRTTVQRVIQQLEGFCDGTKYIIRHTNTKTTHLRNSNISNNDGPEPYPGITQETCHISQDVKDRNILLIDDIYTPGVNIDEDAINALIKSGAKTVTFYAVGRVIRD